MPITTERSVNRSASIGCWMMPAFINKMLMAPSFPSIGRQASTRIRKDVQKGMTQSTSNVVWSVLFFTKRPTKSAVGYPSTNVEARTINQMRTVVQSDVMYVSEEKNVRQLASVSVGSILKVVWVQNDT